MAIWAGWYTIQNYVAADTHELKKVLYANLSGTVVIFLLSTITSCSSIYDPYWSLQPLVNIVYLYRLSSVSRAKHDHSPRMTLSFFMIELYALRLTLNFFYTWPGLTKQDWRYDNLKSSCPSILWPLLNFSGIMIFPTLLVYAGCVPMYYIAVSQSSTNILDVVGCFVIISGIYISFLSDRQLHRFNAVKKEGDVMDIGLWGLSRHPNYFGEIIVWWGLLLIGLGANSTEYLFMSIGAISITLLFVFVSIPMMEERSLQRRPLYSRLIGDVSFLVPWPRKNKTLVEQGFQRKIVIKAKDQ